MFNPQPAILGSFSFDVEGMYLRICVGDETYETFIAWRDFAKLLLAEGLPVARAVLRAIRSATTG